MSDDGDHPTVQQPSENFVHAADRVPVGELDQQISVVIDGVLPRMRKCVPDVVEFQVKIASTVDSEADVRAELGDALLDQIGIERVLTIRVRGGDDISDAGAAGNFDHLPALFECLRAIVETVEYVTMDIDELIVLLQVQAQA
jgi:hypothetical protein